MFSFIIFSICETNNKNCFAKIVKIHSNIFCKKLHLRCFTGFRKHLWLLSLNKCLFFLSLLSLWTNQVQKQSFTDVFYIICNIHRKTPVLESLCNKVVGFKACKFIKKSPTQLFSYEYCKIFQNFFYRTHSVTAF